MSIDLWSEKVDTPYSSLSDVPKRSVSITSEAISEVPSELLIKIRIKYGNRLSACYGLMAEYSKSASIHGIRYIFEVHRPFYEKFLWFMVTLTSLYFAATLMLDTYLKWLQTPVILVFDESLLPVNTIPFPTITICPEIKWETQRFDFFNVAEQIWAEIEENHDFNNLGNLTNQVLQHFVSTLQLCDNEVIERFSPYMPKNLQNSDVVDSLAYLALDSNTTLPFCKWNDRFYYCSNLFKRVLTDEGVCYQFNGLQTEDMYRDPSYLEFSDNTKIDFNNMFDMHAKYKEVTGSWTLGEGYKGQGFNAYPQRSVFSSARNGLFAMMMGFEHNFDYTCRGFTQGYKVFLNSPESVPLTTGNYLLVPHDNEVLVSVSPQYIKAADNLQDVAPEKRQCYFNEERYLRFFKSYSQTNCQTECLVNFTISKCGCAKFWMPKPLHIPVCRLNDVNCYTSAAEEMSYLISNQTTQKAKNPQVQIMCDCMPSCTSLDFNFEISRSYYDYEKTLKARRESYDHHDGRGARLLVYFKDPQFTVIKRTIMFGITTLIANCGGIFGLFMGFSILSLIELVYFFSVRLFNNLRERRTIKRKLMRIDLDNTEEHTS